MTARMDSDYALVSGIVVAALTIPSMLSAAVEGRAPRMAVVLVVLSGGLIAYAISERPGGYAFEDVPPAVSRVVMDLVS